MSDSDITRHKQQLIPYKPIKHVEIDGIAMGVLDDGTPYLAERALARLCGVHHKIIQRLGSEWDDEQDKPRGRKIAKLLRAQGFDKENLFFQFSQDGQKVNAYTDDVCMAILEYYAFESDQASNDVALKNYRLLARQTLRTFIYNKVGYDPYNRIPLPWKQFHDRMMINNLPRGYFSVFKEIADIVIFAIQKGLVVDSHTVPDISVGKLWSSYWADNSLDEKYGQRLKYPQCYPEYFPQAKSNPQEVFVYPISALGEFRMWMQEHYLPHRFPNYLEAKVKQGFLPVSSMELLLEAVEQHPRELPSPVRF